MMWLLGPSNATVQLGIIIGWTLFTRGPGIVAACSVSGAFEDFLLAAAQAQSLIIDPPTGLGEEGDVSPRRSGLCLPIPPFDHLSQVPDLPDRIFRHGLDSVEQCLRLAMSCRSGDQAAGGETAALQLLKPALEAAGAWTFQCSVACRQSLEDCQDVPQQEQIHWRRWLSKMYRSRSILVWLGRIGQLAEGETIPALPPTDKGAVGDEEGTFLDHFIRVLRATIELDAFVESALFVSASGGATELNLQILECDGWLEQGRTLYNAYWEAASDLAYRMEQQGPPSPRALALLSLLRDFEPSQAVNTVVRVILEASHYVGSDFATSHAALTLAQEALVALERFTDRSGTRFKAALYRIALQEKLQPCSDLRVERAPEMAQSFVGRSEGLLRGSLRSLLQENALCLGHYDVVVGFMEEIQMMAGSLVEEACRLLSQLSTAPLVETVTLLDAILTSARGSVATNHGRVRHALLAILPPPEDDPADLPFRIVCYYYHQTLGFLGRLLALCDWLAGYLDAEVRPVVAESPRPADGQQHCSPLGGPMPGRTGIVGGGQR